MAHIPGTPKAPGSGRKKGTRNKRTLDGEAYARAIIEDPEVRATFLQQARAGTMHVELIKTLLAYAFGKPVEVVDVDGEGSETRTIRIHF
jgi:hypothetical protein